MDDLTPARSEVFGSTSASVASACWVSLRTTGVSGTESGLRTARSIAMANAYGELRSSTREVAMTFRMTNAERAQLQREAIEADMSQQQLFELRMFGSAKPRGRDGRPRKQRQSTGQGVLPQTA